MENALTPREVQTRIRAGESVDEVARAAGMEPGRVEAFAVPVLAERDYIAGQARSHPVLRCGETIPHRTLGAIVADRLLPRGVDLDSLAWDAWKTDGKRWAVTVRWTAKKTDHQAQFVYDQAGRFSLADDDDARWLLGLHAPVQQDTLPGSPLAEDSEPTVGLNDDLALVRVVQTAPAPTPEPALGPQDSEPLAGLEDTDSFTEDAYTEGELAEVDGLYDIVTDPTGGIDVLYEMLAAFDEDSVQIYSGLLHKDAHGAAAPVLDQQPVPAPASPSPEQPSLVDAAEPAPASPEPEPEPASEPEPKPKPKRRRAHVPSWDEIMFGSPKQP